MELLQTTIEQGDLGLDEAKGLLDVIMDYSRTWSLLQGYDEDALPTYKLSSEQKFILDFDEAKEAESYMGVKVIGDEVIMIAWLFLVTHPV